MSVVHWPDETAFYRQLQTYLREILYGTLLALDPASGGTSQPGFALFHMGCLQESGTLALPSKSSIAVRLQALAEKMKTITPVPPDVFILERIRGRMAHEHLKWACGVSIAGARTERVLEMPVSVWHALRKSENSAVKGDETDAIYIGRALITLAQEFEHGGNSRLLSTRKDAKGRPKGNPFRRRVKVENY